MIYKTPTITWNNHIMILGMLSQKKKSYNNLCEKKNFIYVSDSCLPKIYLICLLNSILVTQAVLCIAVLRKYLSYNKF